MRLSVQAASLIRQSIDAEQAMNALLDKAREIGCTVNADEIICTSEEQAQTLSAWWLRRKMN